MKKAGWSKAFLLGSGQQARMVYVQEGMLVFSIYSRDVGKLRERALMGSTWILAY
jgi:hypothetical protein